MWVQKKVLVALFAIFEADRARNGSKQLKNVFSECVLEFNFAPNTGSVLFLFLKTSNLLNPTVGRQACRAQAGTHAAGRQACMQTGKHAGRHACRQASMKAGTHEAGKHAGRHACRQASMQAGTLAGRHAQAGKHEGRHA